MAAGVLLFAAVAASCLAARENWVRNNQKTLLRIEKSRDRPQYFLESSFSIITTRNGTPLYDE